MAIQDAAALVNQLARRLDKFRGKLPKSALESAFLDTEAARQEHVEYSRNDAFDMQESQAMQNQTFLRLFPLVAENLSLDTKHDLNRAIMFNTVKLDKLPLPHRPHFIPFADELPAKNVNNGWWNMGAVAAYAGLWAAAKMLCRTDNAPTSFLKTSLQHLIEFGKTPSPAPGDSASSALYSTFLLTTLAVYWTVESYRRCNRQSMLGPLMQ